MKKILLSTLALIMSFGLMAQRNIDLSVDSFITPETSIQGSTQTGTQFAIQAVLTNNSSVDTVKVGDTLIFQSSLTIPGGVVRGPLLFRLVSQEILPGDTQHFNTNFAWTSYLINSTRVTVNLVVFLTNRPNLPIDNGTNNAYAEEMDYINPNGFGVSVTSVNEGEASVFPNPAVNNVTVSLSQAEVDASTQIVIYDLTGKVVKSMTSKEVTNISVDVSELSSGVYTMKVTNGEHVSSNKLTVTK
jgi:hypothetical protein